jgi:hypothetical protein
MWFSCSARARKQAAIDLRYTSRRRPLFVGKARREEGSLGTGWLKNLLAAIEIFVVLLLLCALLYVYWVPLTSSPVRDADGDPRFK